MAHLYEERWTEQFNVFKRYVETAGRFPAPKTVFEGQRVGSWYYNQLRFFKDNKLPTGRLEMLDSFDPAWRASSETRDEIKKQFLLSSDWKKDVSESDVPIDRVFSGDDLYTCISNGICSCRDYLEFAQKEFNNKLWGPPKARPDWCKHIFSFENREAVFDLYFPKLDFGSFNIYYALLDNTVYYAPTPFVECAASYQEGSLFGSSEAMRQEFDSVLGTLKENEEAVLRMKYMEGRSPAYIAAHIQSSHKERADVPLTRTRIEQIKDTAFRKLRHPSRSKLIKPYGPENILSLEKAIELMQANNGDLVLHDPRIMKIPSGLSVPGDLDLSDTRVVTLPEDLAVRGSVNLKDTMISALPDTWKHINGNLNLSNTYLEKLPDNLTVDGFLDISHTLLSALPENLTVSSWLNISNTEIDSLPDDLKFGSDFFARNTHLCTWPSSRRCIRGDLDLSGSDIKELPNEMSVFGSLDLSRSAIKELPEYLVVTKDFDLSQTDIPSLPSTLYVGGTLNSILTKLTALPEDLRPDELPVFANNLYEGDPNCRHFTFLHHSNPEKVCEIRIEELDLSVRSFNCLRRAQIYTVRDIISKSEEDLRGIRNLGQKSQEEIIRKVMALGFDFGTEKGSVQFPQVIEPVQKTSPSQPAPPQTKTGTPGSLMSHFDILIENAKVKASKQATTTGRTTNGRTSR